MQNDDDTTLWREITKDVERLDRAQYIKPNEKEPQNPQKSPKTTIIQTKTIENQIKSTEIDRKTEERLRKGQISIDKTIDLHGFRQNEAQNILHKVILDCILQEKRCVLVITGKGKGGSAAPDWSIDGKKGVLREKLPIWLSHTDLAPHILKCVPAAPKDGGDGAFYVYLRRKR